MGNRGAEAVADEARVEGRDKPADQQGELAGAVHRPMHLPTPCLHCCGAWHTVPHTKPAVRRQLSCVRYSCVTNPTPTGGPVLYMYHSTSSLVHLHNFPPLLQVQSIRPDHGEVPDALTKPINYLYKPMPCCRSSPCAQTTARCPRPWLACFTASGSPTRRCRCCRHTSPTTRSR